MLDSSVAVAAGVLVRDGLVLVCQRGPHSTHAGKWEFPGGKVELGETLAECMRRELNEELAIDVTVGRALWQTRHQYPGRNPVAVTFFLIHAEYRGELRNQVFADLRWVPIAGLGTVDFLDADRDFIAAIDRGEVRLVVD